MTQIVEKPSSWINRTRCRGWFRSGPEVGRTCRRGAWLRHHRPTHVVEMVLGEPGRSSIVAPSINGAPSTTTRNGSPPVCESMATTRRQPDGGSHRSGALRSKLVRSGGGGSATPRHYPALPNGDDESCRTARRPGARIFRSIASSPDDSHSPSSCLQGCHERSRNHGRDPDAAGELKTLELEFDKSEGELQMLEAKLTEHETRLFAGGMSGGRPSTCGWR